MEPSKMFRKIRTLFTTILTLTILSLSINVSCHANNQGNDSNDTTLMAIWGAAGTATILALALSNWGNYNSSESPAEGSGTPVILSSSNYNLMTLVNSGSEKKPIEGQIKILNNSNEAAESGFTITLPSGSNLEILDSSDPDLSHIIFSHIENN